VNGEDRASVLVEEDVREMSEDPRALITQARKVVADCERYLEKAVQLVDVLPSDIRQAEWDIFNWERDRERARQQWGEERERIFSEYYPLIRRHFGRGDYLDSEHRKAVARQMAVLVGEESKRRLDDIAARSDDPELQSAVSEHKEEVVRATRYMTNSRFRPANALPHDEVVKARREAGEILDRLGIPYVDL
jgi:hypothetical protein